MRKIRREAPAAPARTQRVPGRRGPPSVSAAYEDAPHSAVAVATIRCRIARRNAWVSVA